MTESLHASFGSLLAQVTPAATPASATSASPFVYWIAVLLIAAGLAIVGIVFAGFLRGRKSGEAEIASEYDSVRSAPAIAAAAPKDVERASVPRTPLVPAAQSSPSTMEAQNLLRLMGEAEELCTRLGRELDDKAQRIERLLARAEGRLGSEVIPPVPAAPQAPRTPMYPPPPIVQPQPMRENPPAYVTRPEIVTRPVAVPSPVTTVAYAGPSPYYSPAASAPPLQQQAAPQPVQPRVAPVAATPATQDPIGIDPLTRSIYSLADAGHSAQAIAQQLGQHTGKVELILALRPG